MSRAQHNSTRVLADYLAHFLLPFGVAGRYLAYHIVDLHNLRLIGAAGG